MNEILRIEGLTKTYEGGFTALGGVQTDAEKVRHRRHARADPAGFFHHGQAIHINRTDCVQCGQRHALTCEIGNLTAQVAHVAIAVQDARLLLASRAKTQ
jgi:hypothetical protein